MFEDELSSEDRQIDRLLTEMAPLARQRREAEGAAIDPAFAQSLETRLLQMHPYARRRSPGRLTLPRPAGRRWLVSGVAVLAAAVLVLALIQNRPSGSRPLASVPAPSKADLTRNFPIYAVGGGGGGVILPTFSLSRTFGQPYPTRLHLSASHLPLEPGSLPAYRLQGPSFIVPRVRQLAAHLGIAAPLTYWNDQGEKVSRTQGTWIVAGVGVPPAPSLLHSLAVSRSTGELIYHDLRYRQSHAVLPAETRSHAVAAARRWLTDLNYPGDRMPVLAVAPETVMGPVNGTVPLAVSLGWVGTGPANVPAAVVWVAPANRVVEADVWPPVQGRISIPSRNPDSAWNAVSTGRAPIALQARLTVSPPGGTGQARSVHIVQVLVTPPHGAPYLVPSYRFDGTVRLNGGAGTFGWYSLVSAVP